MSWEEKITWVSAVVAVVVPVAYFAVILSQLGDVPVAEIAYQRTLLIAIGVSIVMTIIGAIMTGIGTGVAAEIREPGSTDEMDIGRSDERDKEIGRKGDLVGFYVSSVGVVIALGITMLEYEYFWIANVLYLSFVLGAVIGSVVKLVSYRRGF
jgi:hypothetical protein